MFPTKKLCKPRATGSGRKCAVLCAMSINPTQLVFVLVAFSFDVVPSQFLRLADNISMGATDGLTHLLIGEVPGSIHQELQGSVVSIAQSRLRLVALKLQKI